MVLFVLVPLGSLVLLAPLVLPVPLLPLVSPVSVGSHVPLGSLLVPMVPGGLSDASGAGFTPC
ncbi:hypothetical protein AB852_32905 [Streptomyces uncialis]|uniref:Uncharacterized protein n=1 Tax=Streptomyces uncialis TaxID=1048205 RepID=A0A1Q4V0A6_9ACTN|nr:hypothetical protein AB852_32905 [Streptomyces uncialis]